MIDNIHPTTFFERPEEVTEATAEAASPDEKAPDRKQKAKKRLRYIGPDYAGRITLPHFNRPGDPKRWDEATIRTYLEKWPDLNRFFGT